MEKLELEIALTEGEIDKASEQVSSFLAKRKIQRREATKLKLSLENVLLAWRDSFGSDMTVTLTSKRRFGAEELLLQCSGEECNPLLEDSRDELGIWVEKLQSSLQTTPTFDYLHKTNTVTFPLFKKKVNRLYLILFYLLAGIGIGFAGSLLSPEVRTAVCDQFFTPLYNAYLTAVSFCGIPLIFLSIITGFLGVGNIQTVTKIGKGMVLRFLLIILAATAVSIGVAIPVFSLEMGSAGTGIAYGDFVNLLLGWIPSGVFQPFINSDAVQIILMGVLMAIAILTLNGCSGTFVSVVNDINSIFLKIFSWMTGFIPFFVGIMVIKSMWASEAAGLLAAWKSWVVTTGMQLLFILIVLIVVSVRFKIPMATVAKKIFKTFLIALGTNSCTASVPENYSCCDKLGIDGKVFTFGIPIGTTCYKPATAIRLVMLCFFMASTNNVTVSVGWFLMLFLLSVVFSVAIPAIPGGALMFCTMIFSQLGIPTGVVAQMLATDVFFDCVCTAVNQIAVELTLTSYAGSIGYLNEERLKEK